MSDAPIDPTLDPVEPVIDVPWDIVRAAYPRFSVTDLAASRHFYVDTLGFVVSAEEPGVLYLRGNEEAVHHSLVLHEADDAAIDALGYRVRRASDLDALETHFAGLGCATEMLEAGSLTGQGRTLRASDPLGFTVEFVHEMTPAQRLLQRFDLHRGAFVMRMDHFNIHVPDVDKAFDHHRALGFYTTELIADDPPETQRYGVWMTRKPFVHDLALTFGSGPRLHHVGYTCADAAAVMRACDILGATHQEHRIERGPGRHGVSNAFYLYMRDPDGHRIEFYVGDYYTGDPGLQPLRWSVHDRRRRSFWGHKVVKSWYTESSRARGIDGRLAGLTEIPAREGDVAADVIA